MNYPNSGQSKPIPAKSEEIYRSVFSFFSQHYYRIANTYIYRWESDFFCKTKAGYSIEVEIKISRSDFFADFKKTEKHRRISSHKKKFISGVFQEIDLDKHIPNRFYYAIPVGLVELKEIPDYAGVLFYDTHYRKMKCVRDAPLLHKNKQNHTGILLEKFYWQSINTRNRIYDLRQQLKEKEDFIKKYLKGYPIDL